MAGSVLGLVVLPAAPAQAKPELITERPGAIEAMSTAIAQDERVEDLSARTSSSATFANPDGTWTVESYSGLVRSRVDEDSWVEIDPTLQDASGVLEPAAVPFDVSYSDGGDKNLATVHKDDETALQIGWPTKLSDGEAEGNAVTYAGAAQGDDLVVTSRPDGFNFSVVMDAPPAADAAQVTYRVPISVGDGRLVTRADGSAEIRKGGEIQAALTPPVMWDSAEPAEGEEVPRVPVAAHFEGEGVDQTLVLEPDMEFLQDPNIVYPVTVDPTLVLTATGDTWVQSLLNGTSQDTSPELQVGSANLGLNKFRSYANFDISALTSKPGAVVSSASFEFSNFATGSCAGTAIRVSRVTSAWSVPGLTWNTQPTTTTVGDATSTASYGASGCATETTVSFDATTIVSDWQGGASNYGIQIKADNEGANTGYRKYRSLENGDSAKAPKLSITYNTPPDTPTNVTVTPGGTLGDTIYTGSPKPAIATGVTDPDGGQVTAELKVTQSGSAVASWTSGPVVSGSSVSRTLTSDLADGTYAAAWRVSDGVSTSPWSTNQPFVVDTTAPAPPSMTCPNYPNNSWAATRPTASTTCVITVSADTQWAQVHDGHEWMTLAPPVNGQTTLPLDVPVDSTFSFVVVAGDAATNSSSSTYNFGVGDGGFYAPTSGATFAGQLQVNAGGAAGTTGATLKWRPAESNDWTVATDVTKGGTAWNGSVDTTGNIARTGTVLWGAESETDLAAPANLEIQVCFAYAVAPTERCGKARPVALVEHAFGGTFPVTTVGPAAVALLTGEYFVGGQDASSTGYGTGLSLGRHFTSLGGGPSSPAQAVFGPGWVASLQGPDFGFAGSMVVDTTADDGTITLLDAEGAAVNYKLAGPAAQGVGQYLAQGGAASDNIKLEIKAGSPKTLELTEPDGTITTWTHLTGTATWKVASVNEASSAPGVSYAYTGANSEFVAGIYSGPPGVACSSTSQARGCRALLFNYTGTGTATRLVQVDLRTWDPKPGADGAPTAAAAMVSVPVARYSYDTNGRLEKVWDPRLDYNGGSSHVATTYGYTNIGGRPLVASVTPPGEKTWNFTLNATTGRFEGATRAHDSAVGGTATWTVKYDVATSGAGLPDLSATTAKTWGQRTIPASGAAIFGPDASGTDDYTFADLTYFTADGTRTNTASFGAGAWQVDTSEYDAMGNEVWTLDAAGRSLAATSHWTANQTRFYAGTINVYSNDGQRIEQSYAPLAWAVRSDRTNVMGRKRIDYVYDDEAATAEMPGKPSEWQSTDFPRHNVLIKATEYLADMANSTFDPKTTWYRYQPVVSGDGDGWALGRPTRVSTSQGGGWSTTITRYDADGKVIETRSPEGVAAHDGAGSDARSRITRYYTADASSPLASCRNKPEWADAVCTVGPAGGSAPTTSSEGFDYLGYPTRAVETAGSVQRVAVTKRDSFGRPTADHVSSVNAPAGEVAVPDRTYGYDNATGRPASVASGGQVVTSTIDSWGRTTSYTDASGNTASSTYDAAGRLATFDDGKGTYTYTWDGTDANGKTERRGLVTKLDVGLPSGPDVFTAAADAAGNPVKVAYPNGVVRTTAYDLNGHETSRLFENSVGTDLLGWLQFVDVDGRVRLEVRTTGQQWFDYDGRGRLIQVQDAAFGTCTTRVYQFSLDSNRTSLQTHGADANNNCTTATSPTVTPGSFDGDDRKTDSGYSYDALGRTTSLPAADTVDPANGDVTATYHANDLVASLSRPSATGGVQVKTWSLEPLGRLANMSSKTGGVELRKTANHFAGNADSPSWVTTETRPDTQTAWNSSWTRNVLGIDGGLALLQDSTGTMKVQLANPHGDVVATLAASAGAAALETFSETTEYGIVRPQTPANGVEYGWLGAHQRSGDALAGIVLMGVRLYNPVTGRFLSRDPVFGGNDNAYVYPADPVGMVDLDGRWSYTYRFDLGRQAFPAAFIVTVVRYHFYEVFPIEGRPQSILRVGQKFTLYPPPGVPFPLYVSYIGDDGWSFKTRAGHPDHPGGIQFRIYKTSDGHGHLKTRGYTAWYSPVGMFCVRHPACIAAYLFEAHRTWSKFASNIRGIMKEFEV